MNTINTDEAAATLKAARERLVRQLEELGASETGDLRSDVEFGDGFADAAAATAERTEVLGLIDNLHSVLVDVDAALARIQDGSYGICAKCGEEIGADRLEFRPSSIYCVRCKSAS